MDRRLKPFFKKQNRILREQFGFDVFYTDGSIRLSYKFLDYLARETLQFIRDNNLEVDPAFLRDIRAYAQQDMGFKEFILRDVLEQIKDKFPNARVWTRLD